MHVDFPSLVSLLYTTKSLPLVLCRNEINFEHPNVFMTNEELTVVVTIRLMMT